MFESVPLWLFVVTAVGLGLVAWHFRNQAKRMVGYRDLQRDYYQYKLDCCSIEGWVTEERHCQAIREKYQELLEALEEAGYDISPYEEGVLPPSNPPKSDEPERPTINLPLLGKKFEIAPSNEDWEALPELQFWRSSDNF